ncbi:LLM class flavin-dependent oxidoreductase [Candidatus Halobonum tyrrellensis]|uniref:Luciferase family oxidoreductase, group 1 n=1 Tax=Candidatus Halobonum tyrrellensis G22 TaxID=1324957 RepID=V4HJV2_9EURY|nr:LLM class flavin-dependent oxidoreductase [Candidatus Halobonum tyrrellensis]ESP90043.1 luciferase family oxidoreductase, group 1 [Candidatus Halobonum tyrrellensis G22]
MDLSLVDLAPIPEDGSATEAFENTVERAQQAERLGYSRVWVAEHHDFTDRLASTTPEVLIAHVAARTSEIRVGSGAVLLNHYSPYKVAETFGVLDALAPDRIDLGLGRATGNPVSDRALQVDRERNGRRSGADHAEKIDEVAAHLYGGFDDDHPYAELSLARSHDGAPEVWVLGSSPSSAEIAGELGLPYCFAAFIRPTPAVRAFETYREHFRPSPYGAGPDEPRGAVAANVVCAETDEEAARLRATAEASHRRLAQGRVDEPPIRSTEEAVDELGYVPDPTPASVEPGEWPRQLSGSPSTVRALLDQMADQTGVDEVIVQEQVADPDDALRSHELLAEAADLSPR